MVAKQIQITDHVLLLKHVILSDDKTEEVLKKYNINKNQLPFILKKDSIVKHIGAEVGDVIEIDRSSPTANKVKFYRVVVGN